MVEIPSEGNLLSSLTYIDRKFIHEAEFDAFPARVLSKCILLIAAMITVTAFSLGCAMVGMRLQNLTIDTPEYTYHNGQEHTILSLQGDEGSKNYEATQEWLQCLENYDPEGAIILDQPERFVTVSAHGPLTDPAGGIPNDRAFLVAFCEVFDLGYTPRPVDPDIAYALQCEEQPHTYAQWIEYLLTDQDQSKLYPDLRYALADINGDDRELLRCGSHDFAQQQRDENSFCTFTGIRDGEVIHLAGHGVCYLCRGNVVEQYLHVELVFRPAEEFPENEPLP